MADWRKSRGHLLFLKEFLEPQNIDKLPTWIDWKLMLGEQPKTAIQRFLDSGALVSASLSKRVDLKFNVTELKDMLRSYGLSPSGRNKQDLILRLIQTHPDEMKRAVMDLTVLKCSERGQKIVEHFLTTVAQPPIRDDMFPADKAKKVAKWILGAAGAGAVGGATYDALKKLAEAKVPTRGLFTQLPKSFHNPHEYDAEYILIPGGRYTCSVTERIESVPNMYFAKYLVTNKRYRRFIRYLKEKEHGLPKILPKAQFDRRMIEFAFGTARFTEYLGNNPNTCPEKLRSTRDTDEPFAGKNHPVVGVSWFAASAYCLWMTELTRAGTNSSPNQPTALFRLPNEIEWEWAASGGKREYPWGDHRPNHKLANYSEALGTTTPVGSYPDGATPDGLMDMAGNASEWMENWYDEGQDGRSLRGGSWGLNEGDLRCSYRYGVHPVICDCNTGFRVALSQS